MNSPLMQEEHTRPAEVTVHMEEVQSRSMRRVGYNAQTQQLVIQFYDSLPGLRTIYSGVPEEIYRGLREARSMGQYLDENIRYTYDFALVDEEQLVEPE